LAYGTYRAEPCNPRSDPADRLVQQRRSHFAPVIALVGTHNNHSVQATSSDPFGDLPSRARWPARSPGDAL